MSLDLSAIWGVIIGHNLHAEPVLHSCAVTLVLIIGYLGYDRIADGEEYEKLHLLVRDKCGSKADSIREYVLKDSSRLELATIGPNYVPSLYFVVLYLIEEFKDQGKTEEPSFVQLTDFTMKCEKKLGRWNLSRPGPFRTYWLVCDVLIQKSNKWAIYLAVFSFVKMFIFYFLVMFEWQFDLITFFVIASDLFVFLWVIQRIWRINSFAKLINLHFEKTNEYLNFRLQENIDEYLKKNDKN